jgi:hypothetical protein
VKRIILAGVISGLLMGCTGGSSITPPTTPIITPKKQEYNLEGKVSILFRLFSNRAHAQELISQKKLSELSSVTNLCSDEAEAKCAVLIQMSESNNLLTESNSKVVSITSVDKESSKFKFKLSEKLSDKEIYKILILTNRFTIDESGKANSTREIALLGSEANDAIGDDTHQVLEVDAVESTLASIKLEKLKNALSSDLETLNKIAKDVKLGGRDLLHRLTKALQTGSEEEQSDNATLDSFSNEGDFQSLINAKIKEELLKDSKDQDLASLNKKISVFRRTSALVKSEQFSSDEIDSATGLPTMASPRSLNVLSEKDRRLYLDQALPMSVSTRKEFGMFVESSTLKLEELQSKIDSSSPKQTCSVDNAGIRCAVQVKAYSDCLVQTAGQSQMGMPPCMMEQMMSMMCQTMPAAPCARPTPLQTKISKQKINTTTLWKVDSKRELSLEIKPKGLEILCIL